MNLSLTKQVTFIIINIIALTSINLIHALFIPYLKLNNAFIDNVILYSIEFGLFCLSLYLYKNLIHPTMWLTRGIFILTIITIGKILFYTVILFFVLSAYNLFVEPGIKNLFALFGPMVRGFIFEFAFIAIAAKLFETDIFQKPKQNGDDDLLDKI